MPHFLHFTANLFFLLSRENFKRRSVKNYISTFAVIMLFLSSVNIYSQNSILWGNLDKGKYNVGFKVIEKYDETRFIDSGKSHRPVQISFWYPDPKVNSEKSLLYKDYISLTAYEINFSSSTDKDKNDVVEKYINLLTSNGISAESAWTLLSSEMEAVENAENAEGYFPLVIIAPGNFHPAANLSILSEYLASHGFCVASCSSPTRITGPITDSTQIYKYALDQRDDMYFIYNELKNYRNVNAEKLSVIGYSFGGRGAFLLMNDFNIVKAFISFDSGFANKLGAHWINDVKINSEKITAPVLHIYQENQPFIVTPDFTLVNSLNKSERYLVNLENADHNFFYNIGMITGVIPGFNLAGVEKENAKQKFEMINKIALGFLNSFIKNEKDKYWEEIISNRNNSGSFNTKILNPKEN